MKTKIQIAVSSFPGAMKQGLYALLVPLARICVGLGINARDFHAITKKAFVDAAKAKLKREGENVSVSRVALICGFTRQETSALFKEQPRSIKARPGPVARVIETWDRSTQWRDENGPLVLKIKGPRSFEALCASCKVSSYTAKSLLDHMEADGNVEILMDGRVRLRQLINKAPELMDKALCGFQNIARHGETVRRNVLGEGVELFEQVAGSLNVPPERRPAAKQICREKGRDIAEGISVALKRLESQALYPDLGLGLYIYEESEDDSF